MMKVVHHYTSDQAAFILEHVDGRTTAELTEIFNEHFGLNLKASQMKSYKKNHKLKSGLPLKFVPSKDLLERKAFVAANVEGRSNAELTEMFNKHFGLNLTVSQINAFKKNHGFSSGLTGRFEPGCVSHNKGKKGVGGWEPTQFKKGQKPHNYMPVGTERVNTDGYVDIKIADPNKWKAKHRIIWEESNGPVPRGYVLIFGDGNRLNVTLDNLILVSKSQLSMLNKHHLIQDDVELTRTGIVIADIYRKLSERKKAK